MAALDDLITARDALATELATESAAPRPDYSVGGRSVPWSAYRAGLIDQIKQLDREITLLHGPVEITTIAFG